MGRAMTLGRTKPEKPRRGYTRREALVLLGATAATVGSPALAQMAPMGVGGPDAQRSGSAERRHRRDPAWDTRRGPLPPARGSIPGRCSGLDRSPGSPGARAAGRQSRACARTCLPADLEPVSAHGRHAPRRALVGIVGVRWHQGAELARDPRCDRRPGPAPDRSQHHGPGRQRQPVEHLSGPPGHQDRLSDGRERWGCASAAHPRHPRRHRSPRSPRGVPVDLGCLAARRQFLLLRAPAAAIGARGVGPQQPSHLPPPARLPAVGRPHGLALPAPRQRHDDPAPVVRHQPVDGIGRHRHRREARLLGRPARRCEAAEHDGADRARLVLGLPQ